MNTTQKIAEVYKQMRLDEAKKKMDPVGKADADIDNDGDVDSSDEYLHNRRKAIKKSMKEEKCEDCGCDPCECDDDEDEDEVNEAFGVGKQLNSANMEKAMRAALQNKENFKGGKVLWNFIDADVYMDIKPSRGQVNSFYKMFDRIADKLSKELNLEESVKLDEACGKPKKEAVSIDPDDGEVSKSKDTDKKKKKSSDTETSGMNEAALTVGMKQPVHIDDTEDKGHMDAVKANKAGPAKAKENKAKKLKELRK